MNIRESFEEKELEELSPYASPWLNRNVTSEPYIRETGTEFCIPKHSVG